MLIIRAIIDFCFLIGLIILIGCWIGFIINSFKEGEPGFGFFALGLLLVSSAGLAAHFVQ